jgi:glyoxylase-like metal-dependent hydrolase (beta-lactamase superfamily II)/8-oxo-dGTP pyrophosphatase MutT (NUDIX family)
MSEALPGVPRLPSTGVVPRASAVVVLFRRAASGVELFWLKRERTLRFGGGFYAYPGGKTDQSDAQLATLGAPEGAWVGTAARELFEETGVLLTRGALARSAGARAAMRRALLDRPGSFGELLGDDVIDGAAFTPAGRWVTPAFYPLRFDTRFFLVELPEGQGAEVWPGELSEGEWVTPGHALRRWSEGTALLHPPTLHALQVLAEFRSIDEAAKALAAPANVVDGVAERVEFQRGVQLVPLATPTLPPATHTNCYLLGTKELLVVDPGATGDELAPLLRELGRRQAEGGVVRAVVATHHHADHTGGVFEVAERFGVPVWAHALTADRLAGPTQRLLVEGDVLPLEGPLPMRWRVRHTPGHARGHVCLIDEATKAAVVGDMVAGFGTIVVDPPEGDMADYLAQLERLKPLVGTLFPAHGPAIPDGVEKLDEYLLHRRWREEKVFAAFEGLTGFVGTDVLVERAYDDVASFVLPIAERNTMAILLKLVREGRVVQEGEKFQRAP